LKICLWFCSLFCVAVAAADLPYSDSSDLARSGRVVFQSQPSQGDYHLVLSSIKKVNNQWRAKEQVVSRATISRMTLELEDRTAYPEARRQLQKDMEAASGLRPLFECFGLDCGSSNGWANEFLRVKQLYGLDTHQYYVVLATPESGESRTYVVFYLVQRGNGRIYLQQDVVRSGAGPVLPALEEAVQRIERQGAWVVPGLNLDAVEPRIADNSIDLLLALLQRQPGSVLRLVGHDYKAGSLQERERRSLFYAQWLRDRLIDRGAAPERLTAHGVGHLAPGGRGAEARVEVLWD
jgi:hypothetical protein